MIGPACFIGRVKGSFSGRTYPFASSAFFAAPTVPSGSVVFRRSGLRRSRAHSNIQHHHQAGSWRQAGSLAYAVDRTLRLASPMQH